MMSRWSTVIETADSYLREKLHRVLMWLAFSAAVSLTPLFVNWLLTQDLPNFNFGFLCDRGELFLLSGALCADAIGRLLSRRGNVDWYSDITIIACGFILMASSIEFGVKAKDFRNGVAIPWTVIHHSIVEFIATILVGVATIFVVE